MRLILVVGDSFFRWSNSYFKAASSYFVRSGTNLKDKPILKNQREESERVYMGINGLAYHLDDFYQTILFLDPNHQFSAYLRVSHPFLSSPAHLLLVYKSIWNVFYLLLKKISALPIDAHCITHCLTHLPFELRPTIFQATVTAIFKVLDVRGQLTGSRNLAKQEEKPMTIAVMDRL